MINRQQFAQQAYQRACQLDVETLKPGNVSIFAEGHDMSATDFLRSAEVSTAALTNPQLCLGQRMYEAVSATRKAVGCNTNLGIILLAAPLLEAFLVQQPQQAFRSCLSKVIQATTTEDADWCFRAITLAAPGGLGESDNHDVRKTASVSLLEAMRQAADRDQIANQYANDYTEIFDFSLPLFRQLSLENSAEPVAKTYLSILARLPDSHIRRKYGLNTAMLVSERAAATNKLLALSDAPQTTTTVLHKLDREFKQAGINPGTSADLTVATLLVRQLVTHQTLQPGNIKGVEPQAPLPAAFSQPQSKEISYGY